MAYKDPDDSALIDDIHSRKEFARLYVPPEEHDFRYQSASQADTPLAMLAQARADVVRKHSHRALELQTHQRFVKTYMSLRSPCKRMHLMHSTGCHVRGTRIAMRDGAHNVEDIRVGEYVRAPGNRIARIVALHHGYDAIYRIVPRDSWRPIYEVNADHIVVCYISDVATDVAAADADRRICVKASDAQTLLTHFLANKCCVLRYENGDECCFDVEATGRSDEYFGFTIDRTDGLFLGADGLILHNSGKTRAAIAVAEEHIAAIKQICASGSRDARSICSTASVFVVAFAGQQSFINELINDTSLGYVSQGEKIEYDHLAQAANTGGESARDAYIAYRAKLIRRFTSKQQGGYYVMCGYDRFVNLLFGNNYRALIGASGILANAARESRDAYSVVCDAIANNQITVDTAFLARFDNSLVIADELHNTYNATSINDRGVALQYVLNNAKNVRFLSLDATPINNNPMEIVDFANYFVTAPAERLHRDEIFVGGAGTIMLREGALEKLMRVLRGRLSYLYDVDAQFYPTSTNSGAVLVRGARVMPFLRFIPCAMSAFFINTVRAFNVVCDSAKPITDVSQKIITRSFSHPRIIEPDYSSVAHESEAQVSIVDDSGAARGLEDEIEADDMREDAIIGIPQSAYALFDFVFPNPKSEEVGLYESADVHDAITNATQEWRDAVGIEARTIDGIQTFGGRFLHIDNLPKYSAKYARLITEMERAVHTTGACKMLVFHERVRMTGVLLIGEMLRENGFIGPDDAPNDETRCAVCFGARRDHVAEDNRIIGRGAHGEHEYREMRFAVIHSEIDRGIINATIDKYVSPANAHGELISVLVGSRIIRESLDIKAVRHLFVLSLPVSIPQLVQVLGRCVRRGSHAVLPPSERNVVSHILVNVPPSESVTASESGSRVVIEDDSLAPEIRKYALKLDSFVVTQSIHLEIARTAVDAGLNHNVIMRSLRQRGANDATQQLLLPLFDEAIKFTMPTAERMNVDTFFAYGYGAQEIFHTTSLIKRLFTYQYAWRYEDLRKAVHNPPMGDMTNPALIADESITISLAFLLAMPNNYVSVHDRAITIGNAQYLITMSGDLLYLVPVAYVSVAGVTRMRVLEDIESYLRPDANSMDGERTTIVREDAIAAHVNQPISDILDAQFANMSEATDPREQRTSLIMRMYKFFINISVDQQKSIVAQFVENARFRAKYRDLYAFLRLFDIFILRENVVAFSALANRLNAVAHANGTDPVGYCTDDSLRIYSGSKWFSVDRQTMNMHMEYVDNDVIVGIYQQYRYKVKFRLRAPLSKLREATSVHTDGRKIKRGVVCETEKREVIESYLRELAQRGAGASDAKVSEMTTARQCELIQLALLALEARERNAKSRRKYVYGWWNHVPAI